MITFESVFLGIQHTKQDDLVRFPYFTDDKAKCQRGQEGHRISSLEMVLRFLDKDISYYKYRSLTDQVVREAKYTPEL